MTNVISYVLLIYFLMDLSWEIKLKSQISQCCNFNKLTARLFFKFIYKKEKILNVQITTVVL